MAKCDLTPGLYEIRGQIGFLGYQTKCYAKFIELYNTSGKEYFGKGDGMRHPAAGIYVRKTTARKLKPHEITPALRAQWARRVKQACGFVHPATECSKGL